MTNIFDDLKTQTQLALQEAQAEVDDLSGKLRTAQGKASALAQAYKVLDGGPAKKQSNGAAFVPRVKGGIRTKIIEALQLSPTALDLGAIAKEVYGEDNQITRQRITAALVALTKGADSPVRRVGTGSYTSRESAQHA